MREQTGQPGGGFVLTGLQYRILKWISPGEPVVCSGNAYQSKSKVAVLLGQEFLHRIRAKAVIDFGCGEGLEALDLARNGARKVIGIDIREDVLVKARSNAAGAGLEDVCRFATATQERADIIVSIDAFEHFDDPPAILRIMDRLLDPEGEVLASFGPTWYHPLGGHLFSVFPWAHLLFSEQALMRWRAGIRDDGATTFRETAGGLNQMTIRRFERIVGESPFEFAQLELVPIRKLKPLHNRLTREFTSAVVRCRLVKRGAHPRNPK
jgi:SAM-dependent methyltransferase